MSPFIRYKYDEYNNNDDDDRAVVSIACLKMPVDQSTLVTSRHISAAMAVKRGRRRRFAPPKGGFLRNKHGLRSSHTALSTAQLAFAATLPI